MRKVSLITFLPSFLIALLSLFVVSAYPSFADNKSGAITICKSIADQNGNVVDGSTVPGAQFTIAGFVPNPVPVDGVPAGALPTSSFTTPLTLNSKVFTQSKGNDSQCVTYSGLSFGAYYYSQESVPPTGWGTPQYNDQFSSIVSGVTDVYPYDNRLFSSDQSDVASRNQNADGSIILTSNRPGRTLVLVNKIISIPTPTDMPNNSNGSAGFGPVGGSTPYVCNDTAPGSAPAITGVTYGQNSVTLTWTKAADPVSYYLMAYGTQPGVFSFGNPNVGGPDTTSYTITNLSGGTIYYFEVRAGNGCQPGTFSNSVSSIPTGGVTNGIADGFAANVLGTSDQSTPSAMTEGITQVKAVCTQCIWLPIILGELVVLLAWYLLARGKSFRVNRHIVGGLVAVVAYVIFLILNRGHICPAGGINLILFNIPCKYFWALDLVVYALIGFLIRNRKNSIRKSSASPKMTFNKKK